MKEAVMSIAFGLGLILVASNISGVKSMIEQDYTITDMLSDIKKYSVLELILFPLVLPAFIIFLIIKILLLRPFK